MSQSSNTSLVGSIFERKASSSLPPAVRTSGKTGFPVAQHRSKSAFARARDEQRKAEVGSRPARPPAVTRLANKLPAVSVDVPESGEDESKKAQVIAKASEDWRQQMEEENQRRVDNMSPEELEAARKEILDQFGPDIAEILKQSRAMRGADATNPSRGNARLSHVRTDSKLLKSAMTSRAASPDPMSPGRLDRQIRFAELTPKDVYVYESAPSSPPKQALALPAPSESDGPTVSLGQFKGNIREPVTEPQDVRMKSPSPVNDNGSYPIAAEPEEGTPEDIRRRFFPNVAPNDPSLAWIEGTAQTASSSSEPSGLRFDLSGTPIPPELSETLPVHLGLHHHAEGAHAGYTLEDIFLLSRSTVPAQRAAMIGVLNSITLKLSKRSIPELHGQESTLRKRILATGVEAMSERGSVGVRAVEAMWLCIVAWDSDNDSVEGIELKDASDDTLDAMPVDYVLERVSDNFESGALPRESLLQLLAIVQRLARYSNAAASAIVDTPRLLANILKQFLLTGAASGSQPDPLAIEVLITLTQSSRQNATAVADSAPALLRFIVILPGSSLYATPLATSLLVATLNLYRSLASYGLCSQLATTASEQFNKLAHLILSETSTSNALRQSWLGLMEAWIVCAVDPHRTTPDHDILWSQVAGWEWGKDILNLCPRLSVLDRSTWAALWRAEAAWLEGCSVNGVKGGEMEKALTTDRIRAGFAVGIERQVVESAVQELANMLSSIAPEDTKHAETWEKLARCSDVLASALRLWLACLPPTLPGPIEASPFSLPVSRISAICAQLTVHPLWAAIDSASFPRVAQVHLRSLSVLLSSYLYLSRATPGMSSALWLAQASSIICRLRPGDEEQAVFILKAMSQTITPDVIRMFGWPLTPTFLEKSGLDSVLPLLIYSIEHVSSRIGPLWMTPMSIATSNTQRLPHAQRTKSNFTLPLPNDWIFFPLDHLLRSGQTEAFKALPPSWNFSETDIARATLLFARIHRHVLSAYQLNAFTLTREETVFACMKVFMLEHDQQQETSIQDVFRDHIVNQLMEYLLDPFTVGASERTTSMPPAGRADSAPALEAVSKRFLGEGTPFYQYYTDFVALYDSISFSHPLFARLLLPPTSMRYPVDYRKYLWTDFSHVLRTIKVPYESVIAGGLDEYLWPVEDNPEVLAAYLRSLVKGQTEGVMRLLAVHHIACNIWPDLRQAPGGDERAEKLLQAVVGQAGLDVIKDVVSYRQTRDVVILPPQCFGGLEEVKNVRRELTTQCGNQVQDRTQQLLA